MILNQECEIYRATKIKNQYQHIVKSWELFEGNVPCNIQYALVSSGNLTQTPTGLVGSNEYVGFFYSDQDIRLGDKVIWCGISLFVKTKNPVFTVSGVVPHHIEILFGFEDN